jgi:hypothetical protein
MSWNPQWQRICDKGVISQHPRSLFSLFVTYHADPSGSAAYGVVLRPLACWDCGFESRRGMDVCCECCVLLGRGLCDGLITHPDGSYRVCVVECDQMQKKKHYTYNEWVERGQTKKERKKEREKERQLCVLRSWRGQIWIINSLRSLWWRVSECTEGQHRSDDESGDWHHFSSDWESHLRTELLSYPGKTPPYLTVVWKVLLKRPNSIMNDDVCCNCCLLWTGTEQFCRETIMSNLLNGTGLEAMRVSEGWEAPRFQDIRHLKVVTSALCTGRLHPHGNIPGTNFR